MVQKTLNAANQMYCLTTLNKRSLWFKWFKQDLLHRVKGPNGSNLNAFNASEGDYYIE